jgi:hypothetical protein
MTNHLRFDLPNRSRNARISASFGKGLVGPAGLKFPCANTATLLCPTIPQTPTEICGAPRAVSNLLGPSGCRRTTPTKGIGGARG